MLVALEALDEDHTIQRTVDYRAPTYEMEINPTRKRKERGEDDTGQGASRKEKRSFDIYEAEGDADQRHMLLAMYR
jgi:hypothetical protein